MIVLTDFRHVNTIHEFKNSTIYSAIRKTDGVPVFLKLYSAPISNDQFAEIERRFLKNKQLLTTSFPKSLNTIETQGQWGFILEKNDEIWFSTLTDREKLSITEFLKLAIPLTQALNQLHKKRIVHFDLRPHNIIFNRTRKEFFFFGLNAQNIPVASGTFPYLANLDEDSFFYTSPEQTGRINLPVDQRSDLYSLGAIFYKMLSGNEPFSGTNVNIRIHKHIAKQPRQIEGIPRILNSILQKLLSKSVEDRYQSAFGLLKDLEGVNSDIDHVNQSQLVMLGQHDNIGSFHIPTKLYGTQENVLTLIESFNRVCTASVELILLKGAAGMGKTSLVRELHDKVHSRRGFITRGKFEKAYKDTPYYSLVRAFQILIRQILTEDETVINHWKNKFLSHFGQNGQLIIDFIPEVKIIVGPQPSVPELAPDEAKNRLNFTFKKFLHTFTHDGKPLVVFLDNFQWADYASIQLIQACLSDLDSRYLLFILGYRESGIIHANTLALAVEEIKKASIQVHEISVQALREADICLLIEEALGLKQNYQSLAQIILDKTNGNPFFVKQLLKTFYDKDLIQFDPTTGFWKWDPVQIQNTEIFENVVELMSEKIMDLKPESIEIMKVAACIGNQFDVETLCIASGIEEDVAFRLLESPMKVGLIVLEDSRADLLKPPKEVPNAMSRTQIKFKFLHNRVHLAAYNMLTLKEKKQTHLMLGQLLLSSIPENEIEHQVFKIVNHMNRGLSLIKENSQKMELAALNLRAGEISKMSSAYETAWKYFALGTDLLFDESWDLDYELTKKLYLKRSECEYYSGNDMAADPIFDLLLDHVKTNQEKVEVINIKLNLYIKNDRLKEAVDIGVAALKSLFNEKIPPNDAEITIIAQVKMQEIHASLDQTKIKSLVFLPTMVEADIIAMMELLTNIIPAAAYTRRNLWILLTLKMIELSIKYGNTGCSAYGYMNYAVLLCSGLEDYNTGYAMGRLALDIKNKFPNTALESQLNFLFGSYISHLKDSAKQNLKYLRISYQTGIEYGDFVSAANSISFLMKTHLIIGSPLEEIRNETKKYQDFIGQFNNPDLKNMIRISNLTELLQNPTTSENKQEVFDKLNDQELINDLNTSKNDLPLQWYYLVSAQIHFIFGEYKKALELISESDKLIVGYSQLAVPEHYFYYSLIITINYQGFSDKEKWRYWDILKNNHQKLKQLADNNPVNYRDKQRIIAAQMSGISGNFIEAMNLFDEAIESAIKNSTVQHEALANELAAKYFLSRGKTTIAAAYLRSAATAYVKWGATAKLQRLELDYPNLLTRRYIMELDSGSHDITHNPLRYASDFKDIISSFQSLSNELVLGKLLVKVLTIIMENAGARSSYILIESEGHFNIAAKGMTESDPPVTICSHPLENFDQIARGIIFYVIRTRKQVLLDDAANEGIFVYDHYVSVNKPKSIMCLPIVSHSKLTGIIYLENNLTKRAFSKECLDTIMLLVSQVAIAIDNSLLFTNLSNITEQLNATKTQLEERIQDLDRSLKSAESIR